jgi:hypothetical protein
VKLILRELGQAEIEVDGDEYRQALADGDIDQLLDAYASDIDSEIEIVEPDGTVRNYSTGEEIRYADIVVPAPAEQGDRPEGAELTRERLADRYWGRHPGTIHLMKQFACAHLQEPLRAVSFQCAHLAVRMADTLWDGPELTAGLRKLLEARNCFVCATTDD